MKFTINIFTFLLVFAVSLPAQVITNFTTADGLVNNNINCIFIGEDGVYFGTQAGVSFFDGSDWSTIDQSNSPGLVDNNVTAVLVNFDNNPGGEWWFGTDFGISQTGEAGGVWNNYNEANGLGGDRIRFLGKDNTGKIWAASSKGVSIFDGTNWQNFGTAEGIPFGGVNHIEFKADGTKWLSTGLSGVIVMDDNNTVVSTITEDEGLLNDKVRAIANDDANNNWVATSDGITVINNQSMIVDYHTRPFMLPAPDTLNPIVDIAVNSTGCVWAGVYVDYLVTVGGVSLWDGFEWVDYDEADGLVGPVVQCMAIDNNDIVWVGTSTGISRIEKACSLMTNTREPKLEVEFKVFPNPTTNIINVKWSDDFISKIEEVKLYNAGMQLVGIYSVDSFQTALQIDISLMGDGVYFIAVGSSLEQVVKQ